MKSVEDVDAKVTETLVLEAEEYDTADAENKCQSLFHHIGYGVSGSPAVAVHGVAPAAVAEVIFKGLLFNNVGPNMGCVDGVSIFR